MQSQTAEAADFVTFIGSDMDDIARQFQAHGLSSADYSIAHRAGSHRFMVVEGEAVEELFTGRRMIAATFARRAAA